MDKFEEKKDEESPLLAHEHWKLGAGATNSKCQHKDCKWERVDRKHSTLDN
jgi:hypothetical protein